MDKKGCKGHVYADSDLQVILDKPRQSASSSELSSMTVKEFDRLSASVSYEFDVMNFDVLSQLFEARDILNIYLVLRGLKPSAIIDTFHYGRGWEPGRGKTKFSDGFAALFETLPFSHKTIVNKPYRRALFVANDGENLDKLLNAHSDTELGLALGYPENDVRAYGNVIDGERRDATYKAVSLARAHRAGAAVPSWFAYISFIPESLDIVNNIVSESAKKLGSEYMAFVKKSYTRLADTLEHDLKEMDLPISWVPDRDRSYTLNYLVDGKKHWVRSAYQKPALITQRFSSSINSALIGRPLHKPLCGG